VDLSDHGREKSLGKKEGKKQVSIGHKVLIEEVLKR